MFLQNTSVHAKKMTDSEREEFAYDLANHFLSNTSKSGILAMAIDRVCDILLRKSDEELEAIAPSCLIVVPQKTKDKRKKAKPKGF